MSAAIEKYETEAGAYRTEVSARHLEPDSGASLFEKRVSFLNRTSGNCSRPVSTAFPNPNREGCPGQDVLTPIALRKLEGQKATRFSSLRRVRALADATVVISSVPFVQVVIRHDCTPALP